MQHLVISSARSNLRLLVWFAVAAMVAVLVLGFTRGTAASSHVTNLHQTPPISWDDPAFQGDEEECAEAGLGAGEVLWHFVLVQTAATSATITAEFDDAGVVMIPSYKKTGSTLHFAYITGMDTLLSASVDASGRWLNLSHICSGGEITTTTTTTSTSTTTSTTTETTTDTTTSS